MAHTSKIHKEITDKTCLRTSGMLDAADTFGIEAACEVYKQAHGFFYLGEKSTTMPTCPSKSTGAYATPGAATRNTLMNFTANQVLPLNLLKADVTKQMLNGCITWRPCVRDHETLRQTHHKVLNRVIEWRIILIRPLYFSRSDVARAPTHYCKGSGSFLQSL